MSRQQRRAEARAERWQLLRSPEGKAMFNSKGFCPRRERRAMTRDLSKAGW